MTALMSVGNVSISGLSRQNSNNAISSAMQMPNENNICRSDEVEQNRYI